MEEMNDQFWDQINATAYMLVNSRFVGKSVMFLHQVLEAGGVPEPHPTEEQISLTIGVTFGNLLLFDVSIMM